ncbi:orphan sodium- and chloride-dependent neurotransmitter transporter NTT5 isoform X1 [Dromaius novaehollandiae]|uniref:orphan sodium- and chloride-dependent neurotransmitter transporter NTT5 isoform X1 n=1 Tax=Dromaius novaehollandiae TaxID=8790 RepID=UPI0031202587
MQPATLQGRGRPRPRSRTGPGPGPAAPRRLPAALRAAAGGPGAAALLPGAGGRAEHPPGQHRRLEEHQPPPGRHRLRQLPGLRLRGPLLQRDHRLEPALPGALAAAPAALAGLPQRLRARVRPQLAHHLLLVPGDAGRGAQHRGRGGAAACPGRGAAGRLGPGRRLPARGHPVLRQGAVLQHALPLRGAALLPGAGAAAGGGPRGRPHHVHPQGVGVGHGPGLAAGGHAGLLRPGAGLRQRHRLLELQPAPQRLPPRRAAGGRPQRRHLAAGHAGGLRRAGLPRHAPRPRLRRPERGAAGRGRVAAGAAAAAREPLGPGGPRVQRLAAAGAAGAARSPGPLRLPPRGRDEQGRGGHRPGLHRLHGDHDAAARLALLVGALLPHAAEPGAEHHAGHHAGHPHAAAGQLPGPAAPPRALHRALLPRRLRAGAALRPALRQLLRGHVRRLLGHAAAGGRGGLRGRGRGLGLRGREVPGGRGADAGPAALAPLRLHVALRQPGRHVVPAAGQPGPALPQPAQLPGLGPRHGHGDTAAIPALGRGAHRGAHRGGRAAHPPGAAAAAAAGAAAAPGAPPGPPRAPGPGCGPGGGGGGGGGGGEPGRPAAPQRLPAPVRAAAPRHPLGPPRCRPSWAGPESGKEPHWPGARGPAS